MRRRVRDSICRRQFLPMSSLETRLGKNLCKSEARGKNNKAKKMKTKQKYPHQETNVSPRQDERVTQEMFLQIRQLSKKNPKPSTLQLMH